MMPLHIEFPAAPSDAEPMRPSDLDRIVRLPEVLQRTGLSRATIYRKIRRGTFPRQEPISDQGVGWRQSDVSKWVADPTGYRAPGWSPG